jgi:hypothetical protein
MSKPTAINGRVATQADVDTGNCVFFMPDQRSTPFSFDRELPISAVVILEDDAQNFAPKGTVVTIVQAELGDTGDVLLGVLYGDDQQALCLLSDVEVVP